MPRVKLIFRKPLANSNSIEFLFHSLFSEINGKLEIEEYELPRFSSGFGNRLYNVISLCRFRNCIVHITGDSYYAILGAVFCKRLITIHDLSFLTRTKGIKRKILKYFWVTLPTRFAHKITVVSQTTKDVLLKEAPIDPDKVKVIHNFIHPVYRPAERKFNAACPRILQIGTNFNKNMERLVAALEGLSCILVIIGPLSETQKSFLSSSGIGYVNKYSLSVDELHREYIQADLLGFVSTVEGFGLPVLEAQATGLPVVTSNCSSLPEVAGPGAMFVDPFDTQSIRQGIIEIVRNCEKRRALVAAGYENVKRFSKEKVAQDYIKLYQSL
jgi:glycosyltransferase involved in cell wall biosynthesis